MHITRLIRSEGRKLATTRWFPITVAGTLLLCPLGAFVNVESGGKNGAPPLGSVSSIHHVL
ncbi:MAG: hypothetical protein QOG64_2722, partial [Acidimicrobiaceae bacterium]|nr:hypothetical protein [Acidimicrobiaceae bacterium]